MWDEKILVQYSFDRQYDCHGSHETVNGYTEKRTDRPGDGGNTCGQPYGGGTEHRNDGGYDGGSGRDGKDGSNERRGEYTIISGDRRKGCK